MLVQLGLIDAADSRRRAQTARHEQSRLAAIIGGGK